MEYGEGLNQPRTWPNVYEQYRRPTDQRQYDLPVEPYSARTKLYYEHQRMGNPKYRGLFRDKPHCVPSYYPCGTDNKPAGFHGRLYYEQLGPTKFSYNGPQKDDLYYLEFPPNNPQFPRTKGPTTGKDLRVFDGMNLPQCPKSSTLELTKSMSQGASSMGRFAPGLGAVNSSSTRIPKYK